MAQRLAKSPLVKVGDPWAGSMVPVKFGGVGIALADKLTYLGVVIERAAHFQCDFHFKKVKFFRCLNAVLAKIASAKEISLTLKIVSANCIPILLYGMEACRPTKKRMNSLSYAYNAVFSKL